MKYLLDTCTFLRLIDPDCGSIPSKTKTLIANRENPLFLSVVSAWEIAVLWNLKKISLPDAPIKYIPNQRKKHGVDLLPISEEAALTAASLPLIHKDPFDRMLISQAIAEECILLTPDTLISQYPARVLWD